MSKITNFKAYSQYYDAFYKNKDYNDEAKRVAALIRQFDPQAKTLLELGCGTGNHAAFFAKMGYTTTGLEISEEMVALAKEKKIDKFEPVLADIKQHPFR